jgi:hypothetical protein
MPLKFPITSYDNFKSLPITEFDSQGYSIFIIDYNWNYLYANPFSRERLKGISVQDQNVKDIWNNHREFNFQPLFNVLKNPVEKRLPITLKTHSPITSQSIEICGYPLRDCYFFSVSELPEKNDLLSELKNSMKRI